MAAVKIQNKIVGFEVKKPDVMEAAPAVEKPPALLQRGDELPGTTYKVKPAGSENALYVTINDCVLEDGRTVPFEIFVNSKSMEHFQWVVALTRVISAVFRKGGDVNFLIEELTSVFDPKGGYFLKGRWHNSIVAHIGSVIEQHLTSIGLLNVTLDEATAELVADKRAQYEARKGGQPSSESSFPPESAICGKCHTKAVIKLDGCMTCLSCGDSKCG
jgi:hypothetical protein